jgi:hypothetical protein
MVAVVARPGGHRAAQGLLAGERVGAGAQQLAGGGVEEQQGLFFDADTNQHPAQPLGGQDLLVGQGDEPGARYRSFDLECGAVLDAGQRRWSGRDSTGSDQLGQIRRRQVRADRFDPRPADRDVDQVAVGPKPCH